MTNKIAWISIAGRSAIAMAAVTLATAGYAQQASSPSTAPAADQTGLEDIVVTAQRRTQSLQDVPIATTTLTADQLTRSDINQSDLIERLTPNLQINQSVTTTQIAIRGVGVSGGGQNANSAVGSYFDDVYLAITSAQTFQLYDMERVEVLRGPQGTLYGKNSTGGAINYISSKPDLSDASGALRLVAGDYSRFDAEGYGNLPLSDTLAMRVSFGTRERDGYFRNLTLNKTQGNIDSWSGRVQFLWKPSDDASILLKLYDGRTDFGSTNWKPIGLLPAVGGVNAIGYRAPNKVYDIEDNLYPHDIEKDRGAVLNARIATGIGDLVSVTAYQDDQRHTLDGERVPVNLLSFVNLSDAHTFTQEVRLGDEPSWGSWIVGAFYGKERIFADNTTNFFACTLDDSCTLGQPLPGGAAYPAGYVTFNSFPNLPAAFGPYAGQPIASDARNGFVQHNTSYAGFGDVTVRLADEFSITGGLRYTYEDRDIVAQSVTQLLSIPQLPSPFFPGYSTFRGDKAWDNLSGRVVLDYKPEKDVLLYASAATGFRAGNWNGVAFDTLASIKTPVNPEKITAYEVGAKTEFLDRKLRLNLAAFYDDYKDLQVNIFVNTANVIRNAARAGIWGGEAELTALPVKGLEARLALGYLDATYSSFCDKSATQIVANFTPTCGNNLAGNRLPNSAKWTLSHSLDYSEDINGSWRGLIGYDIRYRSQTYYTVYNQAHLSQGGFAIVGGRIALVNLPNDYEIDLFGENLFGTQYKVNAQSIGAPFGLDAIYWGPPRTWGVSASAHF